MQLLEPCLNCNLKICHLWEAVFIYITFRPLCKVPAHDRRRPSPAPIAKDKDRQLSLCLRKARLVSRTTQT